MKKLLVFVLLAMSLVANGQNYRKVFLGIDWGAPLGKNSGIGSISLEPSYRINDKMSAGFRIEHNGIVSMTGGSNPFVGSLGVSYQYYLPFKPRVFVGGGFAIFNPSNNFLISNTDTQNERNRLGFFPRVGVDLGHFRLIVEYNFVGNMTDYVFAYRGSPAPTGQFESINKNYLNLKIGFFFGGGKK
ncbi:MAG: hypothetical protein IM606_04035 [Cytophagales bacterium]|nr:hypothetical protein [Cytophagales bacterium]MCA6388353.1 hypothetical protein [Cytophagales bacterium]MCA6391325.1 hypothetical protein [Cytophagales bacterium]MCA6394340.1 hypothetical protein [Cytophagales bacterium]MCA6397265.1 hypothetical protein [Cytophagales bacterium]